MASGDPRLPERQAEPEQEDSSEQGQLENGSQLAADTLFLPKRGRPSKFTQEIAEEILDRISKCEPLACICRSDPRFPTPDTVRDWQRRDDAFSQAFACAREAGFETLAAECLHIADTPLMGTRTKQTQNGPEIWTEDMLGHRRMQIETRLKLLAKWDPKRYGENPESRDEPPAPTLPGGASGIVLTPELLESLRQRRLRALAGRSRIENQ